MLQVEVYAAVDGTGNLSKVGILLWKEGEDIQPIPDIPLLRGLIERPLGHPGGPIRSADNPEEFMKGLCMSYSGRALRVSRAVSVSES